MSSYSWPPDDDSGTGAIVSINGDTTSAQLIVGTGPISVSTVGGTTTISTTANAAPSKANISSNVSLADNSWNFVDTSAARNLTLPNPATSVGPIIIKDISGLSQVNNISLLRFAAEQIEGTSATKLLQTNFGSWTFISDNTNWWMV